MAKQIGTFTPVKLEPYLDPQNARTRAVQPLPNLTVVRGQMMGQVTAAGATQTQAGPYNAANADGTQIPIGPSVYDFVTDANGLATLGPAGSVADLMRGFEQTVEIYWKGSFLESDLVGLDANAVTALKASEWGVGALKVLHIP